MINTFKMAIEQNTSLIDLNSLITEFPFTSTIAALTSFRYFFHYYQHGTFKQLSHVKFNQATEENLYNKIAVYWQIYHGNNYENAAITHFSQPANGNYDQDIIRCFAKSIIYIGEEPKNYYFLPSYTKNMFATAFSADAFKYMWQFFDVSTIIKEVNNSIINFFDSSYQYIVQFANYLELQYYKLYIENDEKAFFITSYLKGCYKNNNTDTHVNFYYDVYRENKQLFEEHEDTWMRGLHKCLLYGLDDFANKGEVELNALLSIAYLEFTNYIINETTHNDESEKSKVLTAEIILSALQKYLVQIRIYFLHMIESGMKKLLNFKNWLSERLFKI
jgi:hypothetical protein